jgi:hypothetical protein
MSLINTFPEVELFFKKDKFSEEELMLFIKELDEKYNDLQLRKSVSALISLKILQFQILQEKTSNNTLTKVRINNIDSKAKKKVKLHPNLITLKDKTIENIASILKMNVSQILKVLKRNGVIKTSKNILDINEFNIVSEIFNSRLMGLERIEKSNNPKKTIKRDKPKSLGKQISVYNKIEAIGIGKIIYIRKK